MTPRRPPSFHAYYDTQVRPFQVFDPKKGWIVHSGSKHTKTEDRKLTYEFYNHSHPYVSELVDYLIKGSVAGLEAADTEYVKKHDGGFEPLQDEDGKVQSLPDGTELPRPTLYHAFFKSKYAPGHLVGQPYPVMDLDFSSSGAYSVYNWELFYHVPMTLAIHLSQNQRYEEAQKWFHYVFDPTDDSDEPTPERFWKVKPLQFTDVTMIEQVLVNLSTGKDAKLHQDTLNSIENWKKNPFRPFLIARYRQSAFMFKAVMAYLDNLIAWGDSLFSQYTGETINEALQIYIMAAHIAGPRAQEIPVRESKRPQTYASLRAHLDAFGNALESMETELPFDMAPHPHKATPTQKANSISSMGQSAYFCTPRNDKLLQYWDTIADRLFKIHNSLNIQGIFQQVPLFDPAIDPALLARAAASGLDVSAIVTGLNQPLPLVRFTYLLQKAAEACQEVKTLGGSLLSTLEKKDNETLSVIRAQHETTILQLAESVKYSSWQESIKNREGVEQSLTNTAARYTYYERLLGKKAGEIKIPQLDPLDASALEKLRFSSKEPLVAPRAVDVDIAQDLGASGGMVMSSHEAEEMAKLAIAHDIQTGVHVAKALSTVLKPIPDAKLALHFWGIGGDIDNLPGGTMLSDLSNLAADIASIVADEFSYEASTAAKVATYANRQRDYEFQSNSAAGEITQLFKQLRAAQIREAMAEREWKNHQVQIKQAQQVEQFLTDETKGKTTNVAFYTWMKREVKALYGQSFQFAFNIARKAERALQQELGDASLSYIQYGDLSGKEGLLAGEKLYYDIKRMEMAYVDLNKQEYELTKHVSLAQVNPIGLLQLRMTGTCKLDLTEELFDFDGPGHYFRRIRSLAVSIPCVVGPYTSLNCRLTLAKSSIRVSTLAGDDGYARDGADDPRFSDYAGAIQSIVTSTGQDDSGLFETSLHGERKLPFEWSGVISQWQLDLPDQIRQFDFDTISDVILHVRYTAREGGVPLRKLATANLEDRIGSGATTGSVRLFSMRHEFPSDWAKFKSAKVAPTALGPLTFTVRPEHYPFWSQGRLQAVLGVTLYAESTSDLQVSDAADGTGNNDSLSKNDSVGGLRSGVLKNIALPAPTGLWAFYFSDNSMDDLWLAVAWGKQS